MGIESSDFVFGVRDGAAAGLLDVPYCVEKETISEGVSLSYSCLSTPQRGHLTGPARSYMGAENKPQ